MAGSSIRAFYVNASRVTFKNLTIKNVNCEDSGGAIYFTGSGAVINCNFTDNKATGDNNNASAVYFLKDGEVTDCNFNNNTAYRGGAVFFRG